MGARHWHGLVRFVAADQTPTSARDPKLVIGAAKGKCAHVVAQSGIVQPGGIWAKGCKAIPIYGEGHYFNSRDYVHDHLLEGAAVISELAKLPVPQP